MEYLTIIAVFAVLPHVAHAAFVCDSHIYGRPAIVDCVSTLESIKGGKPPPDPSILLPRLFVEPQFLEPPFSGISPNPFDNDIVQIPKIYRNSRLVFGKNEG